MKTYIKPKIKVREVHLAQPLLNVSLTESESVYDDVECRSSGRRDFWNNHWGSNNEE